MSNYRDELPEDMVIPVDPSVTEGISLEYCHDCDGHFESITTDDGTFLDCNCPSGRNDAYKELDFND